MKKNNMAVDKLNESVKNLEIIKKKLADLMADLYTGRFGTKNRVELISRLQSIYLQL